MNNQQQNINNRNKKYGRLIKKNLIKSSKLNAEFYKDIPAHVFDDILKLYFAYLKANPDNLKSFRLPGGIILKRYIVKEKKHNNKQDLY